MALLPLTLASNRLSETLEVAVGSAAAPGRVRLHPPLLQPATVRQFLLQALEVLP